ncbi:MAG: fibronectin type III domain-containing protein [Butyrivibrio sp.]|nr:fibronectin type III domain-containing protein [Butyrivibrio sp.]
MQTTHKTQRISSGLRRLAGTLALTMGLGLCLPAAESRAALSDLSQSDYADTQITANWTAAPKALEYYLGIGRTKTESLEAAQNHSVVAPASTLSHTFRDLQPGTEYVVSLRGLLEVEYTKVTVDEEGEAQLEENVNRLLDKLQDLMTKDPKTEAQLVYNKLAALLKQTAKEEAQSVLLDLITVWQNLTEEEREELVQDLKDLATGESVETPEALMAKLEAYTADARKRAEDEAREKGEEWKEETEETEEETASHVHKEVITRRVEVLLDVAHFQTTSGASGVTGVRQTRWYNNKGKVYVTWDKQDGVTGYEYLLIDRDGYAFKRGETYKNAFDCAVEPTDFLSISVRTFTGTGDKVRYSNYSDPVWLFSQPMVKDVEHGRSYQIRIRDGKLKVKWRPVAHVSGYRVYASTSRDSDYRFIGEVSGASARKLTSKRFGTQKWNARKTYYLYVEAYYNAPDGTGGNSGINYVWQYNNGQVSQTYYHGQYE